VNWSLISTYQTLPESFIEKYKNYVDWNYIFKYQHHLSPLQNLQENIKNIYTYEII